MMTNIEIEDITPIVDFRENSKFPKSFDGRKKLKIAYGYKPSKHSKKTEILIMGSIPSVEGYKRGFYYLSDANNLFNYLDEVFKLSGIPGKLVSLKNEFNRKYNSGSTQELDKIIEKIEEQLCKHKIVLYDTYSCCIRLSGYDSNIVMFKYTSRESIEKLIKECNIKRILFTSKKAKSNFKKIMGKDNAYIKLIYDGDLKTPSGSAKNEESKAIETWVDALNI